MNAAISLRDATAQEIQLELIRRTKFNDFDGERVLASLLKHRDLWLAALMDSAGVGDCSRANFLLGGGLIKLRDLPHNHWNVEMLFILTETHEQAHRLAQIASDDEWAGNVRVYEDQLEIGGAIGYLGVVHHGLLQVWLS